MYCFCKFVGVWESARSTKNEPLSYFLSCPLASVIFSLYGLICVAFGGFLSGLIFLNLLD